MHSCVNRRSSASPRTISSRCRKRQARPSSLVHPMSLSSAQVSKATAPKNECLYLKPSRTDKVRMDYRLVLPVRLLTPYTRFPTPCSLQPTLHPIPDTLLPATTPIPDALLPATYAGFLTGLKYDTTVMMRSIPLRGFDQQCAEQICDYMQENGTKFIRGAIPASIDKAESGKIKVPLSRVVNPIATA